MRRLELGREIRPRRLELGRAAVRCARKRGQLEATELTKCRVERSALGGLDGCAAAAVAAQRYVRGDVLEQRRRECPGQRCMNHSAAAAAVLIIEAS